MSPELPCWARVDLHRVSTCQRLSLTNTYIEFVKFGKDTSMFSSAFHTWTSKVWQQDLANGVDDTVIMWMEVYGELAPI